MRRDITVIPTGKAEVRSSKTTPRQLLYIPSTQNLTKIETPVKIIHNGTRVSDLKKVGQNFCCVGKFRKEVKEEYVDYFCKNCGNPVMRKDFEGRIISRCERKIGKTGLRLGERRHYLAKHKLAKFA